MNKQSTMRISATAGLCAAVFFSLAGAGNAWAADPEALNALAKAAKGEFDTAVTLADPLARKLVRWIDYRRDETQASFADLAGFIEANPSWPGQGTLRRQAERKIDGALSDPALLAWFTRSPSITAEGGFAHAAALSRAGRAEEASALARVVWRERDFQATPDEERFLAQFRASLSGENHAARLDRLLWSDAATPAQRVLPLVSAAERQLAEARLALARGDPGAEAAANRLPAGSRADPGLQYEQLRWLRRKGQDGEAAKLLATPPKLLGRPERWYAERALLARRAIAAKRYDDAYRLIAAHGLEEGGDFADGEFLAGWLALNRLNNAKGAAVHFGRLYLGVWLPISLARAAYWSGRAEAASGNKHLAEEWFRTAARHPTTFFGQQALALLGKPLPALQATPVAEGAARASFDADELVRAVRLLAEAKASEPAGPLLFELGRRASTTTERVLAAELAVEAGRTRQAIAIAKRTLGQADYLIGFDFPAYTLPDGVVGDAALLLATIRQESGFEAEALSSAGARGMMQLMPATARETAQQLGMPYQGEASLTDPAVNLRLGSAYLKQMLERFGASPTVALAAYNAGPARTTDWIKTYGDPAKGEISDIDWIESLPISETRNYIHRILEAVPFYRQRLMPGRKLVEASTPR